MSDDSSFVVTAEAVDIAMRTWCEEMNRAAAGLYGYQPHDEPERHALEVALRAVAKWLASRQEDGQ